CNLGNPSQQPRKTGHFPNRPENKIKHEGQQGPSTEQEAEGATKNPNSDHNMVGYTNIGAELVHQWLANDNQQHVKRPQEAMQVKMNSHIRHVHSHYALPE